MKLLRQKNILLRLLVLTASAAVFAAIAVQKLIPEPVPVSQL